MENPFHHGVASGDPTPDRVVIWTRVSGMEEPTELLWQVATDRELRDVVARGEVTARPEHDWCVHVDVAGLSPGHEYFYAFGCHGRVSPVARTKTLPGNDAEHIRFATCSCAKFNAGFFNAYARMAERGDLDFLLHLGDYIYEASNTPPASQTPGADSGRPFDPLHECRTLEDYRTRYAQYRSDPDVQALHHVLPIMNSIDDHELADGAWAGGATEHREEEHGPWAERRDAAFQARWEWLPARMPDPDDPLRVWRSVPVGELAEIFITDIRSRRDEPALEPVMSDASRSMLGYEQRDWLLGALDESSAGWKLVATPSIMSRTWCEQPGEVLLEAMQKLKLIDEDGEGPDEDQWDGYPAERSMLLERFAAKGDVVVLSADIHVSIASELHADGDGAVAAEIVAPSLTSQNLDEKLGVEQRGERIVAAEQAFIEALPGVKWCDMASHGYCVVDVSPLRVRAEWWLLDGVLERGGGERCAAAFEVERGELRLREATVESAAQG